MARHGFWSPRISSFLPSPSLSHSSPPSLPPPLQGNSFSGPLPAAFSRLRRLQYLDLSGNRLSGRLPDLTAIKGLSGLLLGNNRRNVTETKAGSSRSVLTGFSGPIPLHLARMTSLAQLDLSSNQLTGEGRPQKGTAEQQQCCGLSAVLLGAVSAGG